MDRIDDASRQASAYVIEMMHDTTKRYVNIHDESFNERVAVDSKGFEEPVHSSSYEDHQTRRELLLSFEAAPRQEDPIL
jgi:hypothetical protein